MSARIVGLLVLVATSAALFASPATAAAPAQAPQEIVGSWLGEPAGCSEWSLSGSEWYQYVSNRWEFSCSWAEWGTGDGYPAGWFYAEYWYWDDAADAAVQYAYQIADFDNGIFGFCFIPGACNA